MLSVLACARSGATGVAGDSMPSTSSTLPDGECDARGTRIVVLGDDGVLRRFTPKQEAMIAVAPIACPAPRDAGGVSFAVDRQGRGWISYATQLSDASTTNDSVMLRVNVDDGTCDPHPVAFDSPASGGAWTFAIRGGVESLYAVDDRGGLYRTDPTTGTVTNLGTLPDVGLPANHNLFAAAIAPAGDGQVFVLEDMFDNTRTPQVVTIDSGDAHLLELSGVVFPHFDYGGYVSSAPAPPLSMVRWDDRLWLFTVDASSKWDKVNAQFTVPTQSMVWLVDPVGRMVVPFLRYLPFVIVRAATTPCLGSPVR